MSELKPCPFCGGEAKHQTVMDDPRKKWNHYVYCVRCEAQTGFSATEIDATNYWNTRTDLNVTADDPIEGCRKNPPNCE